MSEQMPMMRAKPKRARKGKWAGVVPMPMAPAMSEHRKYLVGPKEWPGFRPGIGREMEESARRQRRRSRRKREPIALEPNPSGVQQGPKLA